MDSKHLDEELSSYLAGELNEKESENVRAHLSGCAVCTEKLKQLEQLNVLLSESSGLTPSSGFAKAVLNKIDEERRIVAFRSRRTIVWLAAAAAIVFAVLLLSIQKENQPHLAPVAHWKPKVHAPAPKPTPPVAPKTPSEPANQVSPEDAGLIANLDILENMDVIDNYDNLEYLEAALVAGDEEKSE